MTKEERNALLYKPQNGLDRISAVEEAEMNDYCEQYKAFLDVSKTERECVVSAIRLAGRRGFKPLHARAWLLPPATSSTTTTAARPSCWP